MDLPGDSRRSIPDPIPGVRLTAGAVFPRGRVSRPGWPGGFSRSTPATCAARLAVGPRNRLWRIRGSIAPISASSRSIGNSCNTLPTAARGELHAIADSDTGCLGGARLRDLRHGLGTTFVAYDLGTANSSCCLTMRHGTPSGHIHTFQAQSRGRSFEMATSLTIQLPWHAATEPYPGGPGIAPRQGPEPHGHVG